MREELTKSSMKYKYFTDAKAKGRQFKEGDTADAVAMTIQNHKTVSTVDHKVCIKGKLKTW